MVAKRCNGLKENNIIVRVSLRALTLMYKGGHQLILATVLEIMLLHHICPITKHPTLSLSESLWPMIWCSIRLGFTIDIEIDV